MNSNLIDEFKTELVIPVNVRTATLQSTAIDFTGVNKKCKRAWFTIVTGTVTDGTHTVKFFQGNNAGSLTEVDAVPVTPADSNKIFAIKTLKRTKKFMRVDHVVAPGAATGGAVGVIFQRPEPNPVIDIEEVLRHCVFALGKGARMNIHRVAIEAVTNHVREGFFAELRRPQDTSTDPDDTLPGEPRWKAARSFLLDCSEMIGELAGQMARTDGVLRINEKHIEAAYIQVRQHAPSDAGLDTAGDYCPDGPF